MIGGSPGGGDMQQQQHQHTEDDTLHEAFEQAAMFAVAGVGLLSNCALLAALLLQRRTRRLSSAFVGHSALLNLTMSAYCLPFGRGLLAEGGLSSGLCNSLGTSYIVLMTTAAFNLVAIACCEVYFFDSRPAEEGRQPEGSVCCVLFGVVLVYTGSAILHLGPTLIGANFEASGVGGSGRSGGNKCLFVYGQVKNYVVYTMWVLIVSLALLASAYYLVVFHRTIGRTIGAKISFKRARSGSFPSEPPGEFDSWLGQLAAVKYNRQRVLAGLWCLHLICWYPLYALILMDPQYRVSVELYKFLTILGFARPVVEPLALLIFDSDLGHLPCRLWRCWRRYCRRPCGAGADVRRRPRPCVVTDDDLIDETNWMATCEVVEAAPPPHMLPPPPPLVMAAHMQLQRDSNDFCQDGSVVFFGGDRRSGRRCPQDSAVELCSCELTSVRTPTMLNDSDQPSRHQHNRVSSLVSRASSSSNAYFSPMSAV